jgi:hypothetical protein
MSANHSGHRAPTRPNGSRFYHDIQIHHSNNASCSQPHDIPRGHFSMQRICNHSSRNTDRSRQLLFEHTHRLPDGPSFDQNRISVSQHQILANRPCLCPRGIGVLGLFCCQLLPYAPKVHNIGSSTSKAPSSEHSSDIESGE